MGTGKKGEGLGPGFAGIEELPDFAHPQDGWGMPQANTRGEVVWWNEKKGIGYVRDIDSPYKIGSAVDYFITKDEIKTDPWNEDTLDPEDPKNYVNLDPADVKQRELQKIALTEMNKFAAAYKEEMAEEFGKDYQHLFPGQRVWFDSNEDEDGLYCTNLYWEERKPIPFGDGDGGWSIIQEQKKKLNAGVKVVEPQEEPVEAQVEEAVEAQVEEPVVEQSEKAKEE